MSPLPSHRRSMGDGTVVVVLTLLLGLQPVTTDLYLPALPTLQRDLGTTIGAAQATLLALIVAFGVGQLVVGPLADRFGRRPVLLAGLALYVAASLGGAAAPRIELLVAWRALQGVALAAAVTCGRSIVRDLYEPAAGARMMSKVLTGLGFVAVLSPLAGGVIVDAFGWRAALLALAVAGAGSLAVVASRMPETVPARRRDATRPAAVLRNWLAVVANPTFRAWSLLSACTYGGLFCLLAGSSFVFIGVYGLGRTEYGFVLATMSLAYTGGTWWCRRLLVRHGLRGAVRRAGAYTLAGGGSMLALYLAGVHTPWAILLPQLLYSIGHGVHQPCGQAGAVGPFPEKAGTAASLSGFAMTLAALAVGVWLGATQGRDAAPLVYGIAACSACVATVAWTLVQQHGEPPRRRDVAVEARLV